MTLCSLIWALTRVNTKTGSMTMMTKFKSCLVRSVTLTEHISKIETLRPRKQPTIPPNSERCRTPGSIKKADEIQQYVDSNNSKRFYDALKTIYGPRSSGASPLLGADGSTLLTDKNAILDKWAEHFNNVLNRPSSINTEAIASMPQVDINISLAEPPKELEVQEAIHSLSNGKAPGSDSIPAEIFKAGGQVLTQKLTELFLIMWQQEVVPQDFKDDSIIHI